jgi:hypothetical protein
MECQDILEGKAACTVSGAFVENRRISACPLRDATAVRATHWLWSASSLTQAAVQLGPNNRVQYNKQTRCWTAGSPTCLCPLVRLATELTLF